MIGILGKKLLLPITLYISNIFNPCREEDQRFKRSKLAQTRAEAEQRAEQRAQVQTERVRERQKQEIAKAR